jgi:hypothetical protein
VGIFPHARVRARNGNTCCNFLMDRRSETLGAQVRLQLADVLHVQGAAQVPKGSKMISPRVRQFERQPVEPRPTVDVKWG